MPRGLNSARALRSNRKDQKWADLAYKKRLLGTACTFSRVSGIDAVNSQLTSFKQSSPG